MNNFFDPFISFFEFILSNTTLLEDITRALAIFFTSIFVFIILKRFLTKALSSFQKSSNKKLIKPILSIIKSFNLLLILLVSFYLSLISLKPDESIVRVASIVLVLTLTIYLIQSTSKLLEFVVVSWLRSRNNGLPSDYEKSVSGFLVTFINLLIWILVVIFVLQNIGVNTATLIGGLGIVGIAIGIAVQNVLGDVFSFFSIFFDKPFKEGDFISVNKVSGTIKKIGIRSTKIKSLSGEDIIIPNTQLTSSKVENYTGLEKRRKVLSLKIQYDTDFKKAKEIPNLISEVFVKLDNKNIELSRVNLSNLGEYSLDYEIVYFIYADNYKEYMTLKEVLLFEVLSLLESKNIKLAYPTKEIITKNNS